MPISGAPRLIVAVDFGTTFSGIAFHYTNNSAGTQIVDQWPSSRKGTSDKVPTEIAYDSSAPGGFRWGFDIKPGVERHQWFKLLLDSTHNISSSSLAGKHLGSKKPTDLVTDYLTALRNYAMKTMRNTLFDSVVDNTKIEYILTVPAVWSDRAKDATVRCARQAGMANVTCVSEPEAAANYTIRTISRDILKVGDNFVVCDAGGGTVDLITYKITGFEPLRVEESVVGDGRKCGSTFLNRGFENFLDRKIKGTHMANMSPKAKRTIIDTFDDYIKRDFDDGDEDEDEYTIPSISGGCITITREEVGDIFRPVISEIEELVRNQILAVTRKGDDVKAVLLVGGFGSNNYLKKRLEARFRGTRIIRPVNAWTAVVRGAINYELQNTVTHRQARCHFGVKYWTKFRDGIDPESNRVWDAFEGEYKCNDRMRWYLNRGQKVAEGKAVSMSWIMTRSLSHSFSGEDIDIYCCDSRDAPNYLNSATRCTYKLHARIPKSKFVRKSSAVRGAPDEYKLSYSLDMTTDSGVATFKMVVDGIECGYTATDYV